MQWNTKFMNICGNNVNLLTLRVLFLIYFNLSFIYLFNYFVIFSVLKQYIFLRCLMRDLFYVHYILIYTFDA